MLQHRGDLFVGQRVRAVLFLDHLLHLALEQQQRRIAPQGPLHGNATVDRISQAVSLFVQCIGPSSSMTRFDEYKQGNMSAFTAQEVYGMTLFDTKYNC